jgi:flagellin-like protein
MKKSDKGLSPVIATVLLVGLVVVSGMIIFLWFQGFAGEAITKFGQNAELVCGQVAFRASYSNDKLSITNNGDVPIYKMKMRIVKPGEEKTLNVEDLTDNWPISGLNQNGAILLEGVADDLTEANQIVLTPVLRGNSNKGGESSFACDESKYGQVQNL